MGEIADGILDGLFCQKCGAVMEDVAEISMSPGYPRTCSACVEEDIRESEWSCRFNSARSKNRRFTKKTRRGVKNDENG